MDSNHSEPSNKQQQPQKFCSGTNEEPSTIDNHGREGVLAKPPPLSNTSLPLPMSRLSLMDETPMATPPPPNRRPNSADFADLFC